MFKSLAIFSLLTAFTAANAQSSSTADPQLTAPQSTASQSADQAQPAPIVRTGPAGTNPDLAYPSNHSALRQPRRRETQVVESQPVPGIWLRSEAQPGNQTAVQTISATPQHTEVRLVHGRLNVTVHHPADHAEILVDLPGGQVSLFKDGLYTLNADTNTVRVLHGEAAAYAGPLTANSTAKPIKIKEDHQLSLTSAPGTKAGELKSVESYPYELTADLLRPLNSDGYGDRGYEYGDRYAPYYAGAYGYPGFYPGYYGYGYPFAYGIGFGYYGGFHGGYGGFRGGYHGGFRR